jgi:GMP synthase-like glutamine amidotransferase
MKIHCFKHVPFEGIGCIATWAETHNFQLSYTLLYEPHLLPSTSDFDLLVIMGGPMSVLDEDVFPWLKAEKEFVRVSMREGKKILGICLGAQMIANALGKPIYKNSVKEIGWFPVNFTKEARSSKLFADFPESATVFHWHGETFDLPDQSVLLCSSDGCRNQGFMIGNQVVGLQFHLEETSSSLAEITESCRSELVEGPYIQQESYFTNQSAFVNKANDLLFSILDRLLMA